MQGGKPLGTDPEIRVSFFNFFDVVCGCKKGKDLVQYFLYSKPPPPPWENPPFDKGHFENTNLYAR